MQMVEPSLEDRILLCAECGGEFVFTAGEQEFFRIKQFRNDPKRCPECKVKRAVRGFKVHAETRVTCSTCGRVTTVPFKPTQGRPVECRSCFELSRTAAVQVAEQRQEVNLQA